MKLGEYIDLFDKMPPFMKTDCEEKCESEEDYCSLTIGGPKVYIWLAMVAYIVTIVSYSSEHVFNFITDKIYFNNIFVKHHYIVNIPNKTKHSEGCVCQRTICKGCFLEVMYIMVVALVHKEEDKCCWQNL